jgi:hypothetical protein
MRSIVTLLALVGGMSAIAQTQTSSPWNPTDEEFRKIITVWTKMVDDTYQYAVNKSKITGQQIDPDVEIEPILEILARDPYFDVGREVRRHPSHRKYVERIAALRGGKLQPWNQIYIVAKGLGLLTLTGWFLAAWSKRVVRKTVPRPGASRGSFYQLILLKMSWRILLVIVIFLSLIIFSDVAMNESDLETGRKIVTGLPGFVLICCGVVLVWAWRATKSRFRLLPPADTSK